MTFTRRTYRVAIARSVKAEKLFRWYVKASEGTVLEPAYRSKLITQIAHTARLQRRKRRERK